MGVNVCQSTSSVLPESQLAVGTLVDLTLREHVASDVVATELFGWPTTKAGTCEVLVACEDQRNGLRAAIDADHPAQPT